MSLINQMLQDLEKRQGEPESGGQLPVGVHSAAQETPARGKLWTLLGLLVLLIAGAIYGLKLRSAEPASVPPPLAETASPQPTVPPVQTPPAPEPAAAVAVQSAPSQAALAQPTARIVESSHENAGSKKAELKAKKQAAIAAKKEARKKQLAAAKSAKPSVGKAVAIQSAPVDESQERAEAYYREAVSAFNLGRSAEAQQAARKALAEVPGHVGARQLLVRHLMEQRSNDQARTELREGLKHQPAQMLWSTLLVRLELEKNDVNAARQAVDRAMPYAGQQADFQSLAGAVAQRQGKPDDAADFYRNALRIKPGDGRSWVGLGMSLEAEGHAPEAREAFRRALSTENLSAELQALAERKSR